MAGPTFFEFRVSPSDESLNKKGIFPQVPPRPSTMSALVSAPNPIDPRDPRKTPPQVQQLSSPPSSGGRPHPYLLPAPLSGSVNNSQMGQMYPPLPPPPDWQRIVYETNDRVASLEAMLREANARVAHYKMQHHLLTIETEDAAKRQEVEQIMLQREVEVLSSAVQKSGMGISSPTHPSDQTTSGSGEWTNHSARDRTLQAENQAVRSRLAKAEAVSSTRYSEKLVLEEENARLRKRILENREHYDNLRADAARIWSTKELSRNPTSNSNQYGRPPATHKKSLSMNTRNISAHPSTMQSTDGLSALLLADQVLSQESRMLSASAPSTPITGTRIKAPRARRPYASMQSTPATYHLSDTPNRLTPIQEGSAQHFENANQAASILASIVSGNGRKRSRSPAASASTISSSRGTQPINGHAMDHTSLRNTVMPSSQAAIQASRYLKEDLVQRPKSNEPLMTPIWKPADGPLPSGIFGTSAPSLAPAYQVTGEQSNEHGLPGMMNENPAKRAKREDDSVGLGIGNFS